jgi:hypothetical protein
MDEMEYELVDTQEIEIIQEEKPKRTRKPKVVDFKEDATDGDDDGYVQDATIWERPIKETVEEVVEEELVQSTPAGYLPKTGESYLDISKKFRGNKNATEYAKELRKKNKDVVIRTGIIISL